MISQRSSDRSQRTDSTQRRPTIRRGIKKRGILPSFGDIVLPVVSVIAVGLLVLAGRQFFLNGIKTSPGISSTRAYAEAPALIAERERKKEKEAEVYVSVPVAEEKDENPALDSIVKQEAKQEINAASVPETQKQTPVNVSQTPPKKISPAPAKPVQAAKPQPPKPQVKPQPKAQTAKTQASSQKKNEPAKPAKKEIKETPVKTPAASSTPSSKQWRVQIGAYTSKSGAQEAANKLKKAGYSAVVYSNPASKHHKVWVAGGANKKDAERVVNAMKKLGYGSSFAFPPAK